MALGTYSVNGTVSYASQEAWVFAATVRQNIIFGSEFDKKRYKEVVKACALEKDFEQFSNGDLTIVGDRGKVQIILEVTLLYLLKKTRSVFVWRSKSPYQSSQSYIQGG